MNEDTSTTLLSSLKRFFTGTLLSRITGMGREVIMAAAFGTTPVVATFWMAFRFAHLLRRLFGEGALHAAFVPHFESLRKKDAKEGAAFFLQLSNKVTFFLVATVLILEMILGSFLISGTSHDEVIRLTMVMLPSVIFISLHALNTSLLQCERKYFLSSASPMILNLVWIGCIALMWSSPPVETIRTLAIVVVFAFVLQWLSTQIPAAKYLRQTLGPKIVKNESRGLFAIFRPFFLGMLGVAAQQINNGLDALFAAAANVEGPAILWYALRLQQLPLALLGVGLSGALLPPISRALQGGDTSKAIHFLNFSLHRVIALMIPITAAIFALGFVSVNLAYGRGEFNSHSLFETTYALLAYGGGLFPMTATLILAACFYAMKNYKIPTLISLCSVALNIFLNSFFVYVLGWGAISIAIATTVAAFFNAFALFFLLSKKLPSFSQGLLSSFFRITFAALCATTVTLFLSHTFHLTTYPRDLVSQMIHFSTQTFFFGTSLFLFAFLFRAKEILNMLPVLTRSRG